MAEHSQRYLRRTFLAVREHAGVYSYKFKCVHSNSPGRPSLTYPQLSAFFFSSSLSSSSDLSITRPLRLLPALRQPLTKRQCLNGFASTADMAVSVPEITPVPCLSHWEMMEGPWQSKGRGKWTESWGRWLTDSLQAPGNGEWLLPRCPLWRLQCIYSIMGSSNNIQKSTWNRNWIVYLLL